MDCSQSQATPARATDGSTARPWTRRLPWLLSSLAAAALPLGCGLNWRYTFVEAENLAKAQEKPILVFYRDHLASQSGRIAELLADGEVAPLLNGFVLCSLVSAYGPNRQYMFQYDVASAPALVIIHPDGTYHALTDGLTAERIKQFIASAKPPGRRPEVDIQVPRPSDYLVRAEGIYENAVDKARRLNRNLLIIYKWWLSPESTEMLYRMSRPEVASRCTETVNCVLDWDYVANRSHVARYGVTSFPAIIVVHQDGSHRAHQGLATVDEIVAFLSRELSEPRR